MAYTTPEIITWAKLCQPLARVGEMTKKYERGKADLDLDIKIYLTRLDVEYAYAQYPGTDETFAMGNFLLSLLPPYLFVAQQATAGGGNITPITPSLIPTPYDFEVTSVSFIATGATTKVFPASWQGFNILFIRNHVTQSIVNEGGTYYSWDRTSATLTLFGGAAQDTEIFQIYPV